MPHEAAFFLPLCEKFRLAYLTRFTFQFADQPPAMCQILIECESATPNGHHFFTFRKPDITGTFWHFSLPLGPDPSWERIGLAYGDAAGSRPLFRMAG